MRRPTLGKLSLLALLALLVPLLSASAAGDDEIVTEFRRYFRKFKDTATRVEAVLALEGTESPAVVDALAPVLADGDPEVVKACVRVLASFRTPEPVAAIFARLPEESKGAVRAGLLHAIAEGGYKGPTEAFATCLADREWDVRRRALQALAASGAPGAVELVAPLCTDSEPAVRCAALEGLALLRSEQVLDPAIAALEDPVWQVRSSAAFALKCVRSKRSIEPLIRRMETEEGRLLVDYGAALEEITGKGFDQRVELWRQFWDRNAERFEIPTDEEMEKTRAAKAEARARYTPPGAVTYHGIDTPSRSIVFVIDVSGSMENQVVEKDRFKDGDYPSYARIDIVKTELSRTIEGLEPYVNFNIYAFATDVKAWKKKLVNANVLNKRSAIDWVERLEAIGGTSKEDLASVGLVGAANLEAGKTNTFAALMAGLNAAERGEDDDDYATEIDTLFFLSDGRPTDGELVDPDDILREVKRVNDLRKIVIHTIAIGEFQKDFMERLALQNGGAFVDLGK